LALAARGQQIATPVSINELLHASAPEVSEARLSSFRKGLSEAGYEERQNLAIEYAGPKGQYDRLPAWRPSDTALQLRCSQQLS